jgi:hypothetical protein
VAEPGVEVAPAPAPAPAPARVEIEIVRDGEGGRAKPWSVRALGKPGTFKYADDAEQAIRFVNAELRKEGITGPDARPDAPEVSIVVRDPAGEGGAGPVRRWRAKRGGWPKEARDEFRYVEARDKREALQVLYIEVASASRTPSMLDRVGRSVHTDGYKIAWYLTNEPEPEEPEAVANSGPRHNRPGHLKSTRLLVAGE